MSVVLELEHDMHAPAQARHWLEDTLRAWGCQDFAADAGLLVSELTTNAVLHAGTGCRIEADFDGVALRVTVSDQMPGDLSMAEGGIDAEGGWGLTLVNAMANTWGVSPTQAGKSVWFALWSPTPTETPLPSGAKRGDPPAGA